MIIPKKCKCGKMINRPLSNKSGLCCSCYTKKASVERKYSSNAENTNSEVVE